MARAPGSPNSPASEGGGIVRVVHDREHPYVMVARALAQHRGLSFAARGLMLYLLSKPPGWQARMADLQAEGGIARFALRSILHELQAARYLTRERLWDPETKRLTWVTTFYETPQEQSVSFQPIAEQPADLQPIAEQPIASLSVETPPIYKVETGQSKELQKKEALGPDEKGEALARNCIAQVARRLGRDPQVEAQLLERWRQSGQAPLDWNADLLRAAAGARVLADVLARLAG